MIIRREQMNVFADSTLREFERRTLSHLSNFYPQRCAAMGTGGSAEFVRNAIRAAQDHQIVTERDVVRYVDLAAELEAGPDLAVEYDWAAEILNQAVPPDEKLRKLYTAATERKARHSGA